MTDTLRWDEHNWLWIGDDGAEVEAWELSLLMRFAMLRDAKIHEVLADDLPDDVRLVQIERLMQEPPRFAEE